MADFMKVMVTRPGKADSEAPRSPAMMSKWDLIRSLAETVIGCAGLTVWLWYVTVWLSIPVLYQCPSKQRNLSLPRHGLQAGTDTGTSQRPQKPAHCFWVISNSYNTAESILASDTHKRNNLNINIFCVLY